MAILFYDKIPGLTKSLFLKDLEWGWLLILIPGIYFIGHIFGTLSFGLLGKYKSIRDNESNDKCKNKRLHKCFECEKGNPAIRCLLLYGAKTTCAIEKSIEEEKDKDDSEKHFKTVPDFWTKCAFLQIEKIYAPAEYFYHVNELFQSLILIFAVSSFVAFTFTPHWVIGLIYIVCALFSYRIAREHAARFVETVIQTLDARDPK